MTDLVFLLLIFFMIVATMIAPNVNALKLVLPNSNTADKTKNLSLSVSINEQRQYFVSGKPTPVEVLKPTLEAALAGKVNPVLILHTEYSVPISDVVTVMDIANQMKVKLVLATQPEK